MAKRTREKTLIGINVRRLRAERHLSVQELASIAGLSFGAIQKWERYYQSPGHQQMLMLADAFEVPTADLDKEDPPVRPYQKPAYALVEIGGDIPEDLKLRGEKEIERINAEYRKRNREAAERTGIDGRASFGPRALDVSEAVKTTQEQTPSQPSDELPPRKP